MKKHLNKTNWSRTHSKYDYDKTLQLYAQNDVIRIANKKVVLF